MQASCQGFPGGPPLLIGHFPTFRRVEPGEHSPSVPIWNKIRQIAPKIRSSDCSILGFVSHGGTVRRDLPGIGVGANPEKGGPMKIQTLDHLLVPARNPSKKWMLVLHGRGDSYDGFRWLPSALGIADLNYLLVNAPDPYYTGFSWYDLPPRQGPGILRSRERLDRLLTEMKEAGIAYEDIVFFGFSQGCLMALEWGGRSELPLAAMVGISGYVYDAAALSRELTPAARCRRWLVTHGAQDEVLSCKQTEAQIGQLQKAGLPIEYHRFQKSHTIDLEREIPLIRDFVKTALSG